MSRSRNGAAIALACSLAACAADESEPPPPDPATVSCAPGELTLEAGGCLAAGVQENGCAAGESLTESGDCRAAGIPPEMCAEGFSPDPLEGCIPVLPGMPCALGTMAVPGETSCHEIGSCGSGTWGAIPVSGSTQHVDAAYTGGASNGSAAQPWTTIQEAVAAASAGAIVAIAAGSYVEDVVLQTPVTLWGRCAKMVEIVGAGGQAAVLVPNGATGSAIRGLAVRGPDTGIVVSGVEDVTLEELWVHDANRGIAATDQFGDTSVLLVSSLLEQVRGAAFAAFGADFSVERTVARDGQASAPGAPAFGFVAQDGVFSKRRANGRFATSIADRNLGAGFLVVGSDAIIEGAVARGTKLYSNLPVAWGIAVQLDLGLRAAVTVRSSVVEGTHDAGIMTSGSDVIIEGTVIRDTAPEPLEPADGWGIGVQSDAGSPGKATVRSCLVNRAHQTGIVSLGAELEVESTVVRDTRPLPATLRDGWGLIAQVSLNDGMRGHALIRTSVIEQSRDVGLLVLGADATIEGTLVRTTLADEGDGRAGMGIAVSDDVNTGQRGAAQILHSVVEDSTSLGVLVGGSQATIEATVVRDTRPDSSSNEFGRGIQFQPGAYAEQPANGTVNACVVERNYEVGVAAIRADLAIDATLVRDVLPTVADGLLGDGVSAVLAPVSIARSHIETVARAGISSFGAQVSLSGTRLECALIPLEAEVLLDAPGSFADLGGNVCGCSGETKVCRAVSSMLAPPDALPPPGTAD